MPAMPWDSRTILEAVAIAVLALLLLWAIWWLWWRLPKRQVRKLDIQIHDPKARADNFHKTVGQALGGVAVLIGAVAYLQFTQQQRASDLQSARQQQAAHDLLVSNQVSKGFAQLANKESVTMPLGGIHALEGVMNASKQYHLPVLEALCAFVREGTKGKEEGDPATDIQTALTVIGRQNNQGHVDLQFANLNGAILIAAHLHRANLFRFGHSIHDETYMWLPRDRLSVRYRTRQLDMMVRRDAEDDHLAWALAS